MSQQAGTRSPSASGDNGELEREALRTVLRRHPDVLYVTDPETHEVLLVNEAFEEMLGEDPVGKVCHQAFQGLEVPCPFCTDSIIQATGKPYQWEYYNPKVDRHYWITDQIIPWPDGRQVRLEVATDISDRKRAEHDLVERTKELRCLLGMSQLVDRVGHDWDALAQGLVDMMPAGWQFPEITAVRLTMAGRQWVSAGFRETPWRLAQEVDGDAEVVGCLEVVYLEARPDADEGPFLQTERALLDALAERLGHVRERAAADRELVLHRERLEELVAARTTALEEAHSQLQSEMEERERRGQIIERQAQEILDISTPVMEVWQGLVVAPLIGALDSERAQQLMERLLGAIVEHRARVALVDITGVPAVDTQTAQNLIEAVTAARLLGARVILTGVRPAIAQTLVHLGIDLGDLDTRASLSQGLALALAWAGQAVVSVDVSAADGAPTSPGANR